MIADLVHVCVLRSVGLDKLDHLGILRIRVFPFPKGAGMIATWPEALGLSPLSMEPVERLTDIAKDQEALGVRFRPAYLALCDLLRHPLLSEPDGHVPKFWEWLMRNGKSQWSLETAVKTLRDLKLMDTPDLYRERSKQSCYVSLWCGNDPLVDFEKCL